MKDQHFAALLGFAFAAAWIGFGFGEAILCLIAAGVFYLVSRFTAGDLEIDEVRERLEGARSGFNRPGRTTGTSRRTRASGR